MAEFTLGSKLVRSALELFLERKIEKMIGMKGVQITFCDSLSVYQLDGDSEHDAFYKLHMSANVTMSAEAISALINSL